MLIGYKNRSRRKDRVKILYWDRDGFTIWSKRLEEGTYAVPFGDADTERQREITAQELGALLSGIDLSTANRRKRYRRTGHKTSSATVVFYLETDPSPRKLEARCRSIRTACGGMRRRCRRSSSIWPNNWIVSLAEQNKYQSLLREFLEAQRNRKSEQLSKEQWALFEAAWKAQSTEDESAAGEDDDDLDGDAGAGPKPNETQSQKRGGRQPLARHLNRERIVHDLAEAEKHCAGCGKDLRLIAEETSERYEYIPASMKVIQDVCLKYACDCTVRTATKPPQPIEKSRAGASLLAQVIVAKWADHQPLHRQEKIFERHGIDISRKTMGGWMVQCAELLDPLYQLMKKEVLSSKVIGTDDTSVKVLDRKLPFARLGRIWPYVGDAHHPVIVYDYTPTRSRTGPAKFLEGYKGYLQADAYSVYDAFFKSQRGMTEVGCWMHDW
jgi:transposase